MDKETLVTQAKRIKSEANNNIPGSLAQAKEFLKTYAGAKNSFLQSLENIPLVIHPTKLQYKIQTVLDSFIKYVENDLLRSISLEREIQIETVSEYLEQAEMFLNNEKVHPAGPAVLIGASLEEFLRNWLEEEGVDMTIIKKSLDSYSNELRKRNKITKQDSKDIISWGGIRNDAAHGYWDNVKNREKIKLMLGGVNLFMRKYS